MKNYSTTMHAIGVIHTPFEDLRDMPIQPRGAGDVIASIEINEEYMAGLKDLEGFSHLYLIYHFHEVLESKLEVVPFNDMTDTKRGVFATRAPVHPNRIGLSVVELVSVKDNVVYVRGIDVLNGTPILDIKPYIENFDKIEGETSSGWMLASSEEVVKKRSDDRFVHVKNEME